jgi:hypothetical protein
MASIYLFLVASSQEAFSAASLSKCKLPVLRELANLEKLLSFENRRRISELLLLMTFSASLLVFFIL